MKSARRSKHSSQAGKTRSRLRLPLSKSQINLDISSHPVASMPQARLQLLREAFNLIDQDGDGTISRDDLIATYKSLGTNISNQEADEMLSQAKSPLTYTTFACMLAARTADLDESNILLNAFGIIDEDKDGKIHIQELSAKLQSVGYDRMSADEIVAMVKVAPMDLNGNVNYHQFVNIIRGVMYD